MTTHRKHPFEDLSGKTFGQLAVIKRVDHRELGKTYGPYFLCECSCGNQLYVRSNTLRSGKQIRCRDCYLKSKIKHGYSKTRLYGIWKNMKDRILNNESDHYSYYGGKGLTIYDDWLDFLVFRKWALSSGYDDSLSIERLDNSKGYCPENCTWIPIEKQARNKTTNLYFEINGEKKLLKEWADVYGIAYSTVYGRVFNRNIPVKEALTAPLVFDHKYRGVHFRSDKNKWVATFNRKKKRYFVGYFDDKDEALQAKIEFMKEKGFLDAEGNYI